MKYILFLSADTVQSYNAVLAILQLIITSGFDIKLEASRQLLSILVSRTTAAKNFAKQLGWQEALSKLFILRPISIVTSDFDLMDSDIVMENQTGCDNGGTRGSDSDLLCSNGDYCKQNSENVPLLDYKVDGNSTQISSAISPNNCVQSEKKSSPNIDKHNCDNENDQNGDSAKCDNGSTPVQKRHPPTVLDLTPKVSANNGASTVEFFSPSLNTPSTPLYLKSQLFNEFANFEDDPRPMSRSSSASAEDLSTIAQRAAERKSLQREVSSTSIPLLAHSESGLDLSSEGVELRRDSISSSWHQNNTHRMLSSLGLRGSFLMDVVENSEELCQNLLIVLYTIMWKGVEGSDETAWKVSVAFITVKSGLEISPISNSVVKHSDWSSQEQISHSTKSHHFSLSMKFEKKLYNLRPWRS